MPTTAEPTIIRHIFPARSECPACKQYGHDGFSGGSQCAPVYHRRCRHCRHTYKVTAIAREVFDGGAWSRIEVLA